MLNHRILLMACYLYSILTLTKTIFSCLSPCALSSFSIKPKIYLFFLNNNFYSIKLRSIREMYTHNEAKVQPKTLDPQNQARNQTKERRPPNIQTKKLLPTLKVYCSPLEEDKIQKEALEERENRCPRCHKKLGIFNDHQKFIFLKPIVKYDCVCISKSMF